MKFCLFQSCIDIESDVSWLNSLNEFCEKYINDRKELNKKKYVEQFGLTHHSEDLVQDNRFSDFVKYLAKKSFNLLEEQGYDLQNFNLVIRQLWVQEFSNFGGGSHNTHVHSDGHISGFYFLKCSDKTSFPIFHDPRPGKLMIQLPEKNKEILTDASEKAIIKISPGVLIFFNSYLPHEFPVDTGKEPFRFIHFNIQAIPKELSDKNSKIINLSSI